MSSALRSRKENLPTGWKWAKLADVCVITLGQSPPSSTYSNEPSGLPFFQGKADFGDLYPTPTKWCSNPQKMAGIGDILISVRAPVGPTNIANVQCCIGRGLASLRSLDALDPDFLLASLKLFEPQISGLGSGSTFSAITGKQLKEFEIPLPPLAEQKRIVAVLNEQMGAVELAKKAAEERLEAAQALQEALLHSWFASPTCQKWPSVTLGNLVKLRKEIVHPRDNPTGAATFVGLEHIASGTGQRLGHEHIEKSELTGRKPVFLKGDIVYGYLRPYLNKVWVAEFDGLCSVDQYVYKVDTNRVRPCFLARFMRSGIFLQRAPISESPGQLPRIRTQEVASVSINLPPLSVQKAIESSMLEQEEFVEALLNSISVEKDSLDKITSALLRRAFSGEI